MKLNDLDLNKLSTFLAVVEAGGVGKAGKRLGRSSSAVSQSITALEAALDCKLFDRVGKQLIPTRGGQALHTSVAAYQELLERSLEELSGSSGAVTGLVRMGLFLGFPRLRLCTLLTEFARLYPRASLRVVYAPEQDLGRRLRKNQLDYVFSLRAPNASSADLNSTALFAQELVLVSGARFFKRRFSPGELSTTPVVDYYQSDPLITRWLAHHYPGHVIEPDIRFWAATTDLVLDLVLAGAGVGVLPRQVARSGLGARRLKELGPLAKPLIDHLWLNEPRGAHRDATLRAFRELVLRVLEPDAGVKPGRRSRPTQAPPRRAT
jgi:DNA-binding transcriptional LysR family regulator